MPPPTSFSPTSLSTSSHMKARFSAHGRGRDQASIGLPAVLLLIFIPNSLVGLTTCCSAKFKRLGSDREGYIPSSSALAFAALAISVVPYHTQDRSTKRTGLTFGCSGHRRAAHPYPFQMIRSDTTGCIRVSWQGRPGRRWRRSRRSMVDGVQPILKSQSSCTLFVGVNADKALLLLGPLNTGDSDLAPPPNRCCCFSYSLFHFIDHSHVHMPDDWLLFTFISTLGTYLYDIYRRIGKASVFSTTSIA